MTCGIVEKLRSPGGDDSIYHLQTMLPGKRLSLPAKDHFGRSLPRTGKTLIVLSGCNSCTVKPDGTMKVEFSDDALTFVTEDSSDVERFKTKEVQGARHRWLIVDSKRLLLPKDVYDVAPIRIVVDVNNIIEEVLPWR